MRFLANADWSVSLETRILKCYLNYPIGQLSDFLLPLDPRQVPSFTPVPRLLVVMAHSTCFIMNKFEHVLEVELGTV